MHDNPRIHRLGLLILAALCAISITNCGGKKESAVVWNLNLHDTGNGVLMDVTGATILFKDMTYQGTNRGELQIYDPDAYVDNTGLGGMVEGWGSPEQPGRPELAASYSSAEQQCDIKFGKHRIVIRDKGQKIEIGGFAFEIDPEEKPEFVVSVEGGKVTVEKQ